MDKMSSDIRGAEDAESLLTFETVDETIETVICISVVFGETEKNPHRG
jgi:hypothetical protein